MMLLADADPRPADGTLRQRRHRRDAGAHRGGRRRVLDPTPADPGVRGLHVGGLPYTLTLKISSGDDDIWAEPGSARSRCRPATWSSCSTSQLKVGVHGQRRCPTTCSAPTGWALPGGPTSWRPPWPVNPLTSSSSSPRRRLPPRSPGRSRRLSTSPKRSEPRSTGAMTMFRVVAHESSASRASVVTDQHTEAGDAPGQGAHRESPPPGQRTLSLVIVCRRSRSDQTGCRGWMTGGRRSRTNAARSC